MGLLRQKPLFLVTLALVALVVLAQGGTVACDSPTPTSSSPPPALSADTPLVLFARPRLLASVRLTDVDAPSGSVHVRSRSYSSGEDILRAVEAGYRADVVEVCTNETAERLAREGRLRPLETDRIEQWSRLYPVLKDLPGVVVDGRVYMVPVTAAVTGILYDPTAVTTPPGSFGDLLGGRFQGRLAFEDDAALAFQVAALDLALPDPAALDHDETLQAEDHLKHFRKSFRAFWGDLDDLASAFEHGRVTAATGDRRDAFVLSRRGIPVVYTPAAEGQPLVACGLAITAAARDVDAAYALINRYLDPATQAVIVKKTGDLASNRAVDVSLARDGKVRLRVTDLDRLDHPFARLRALDHLDWVQAWYEVKSGHG